MYYHEAENILHQYTMVLADEKVMSNNARHDTQLPCSKDRIVEAYKVFMAFGGTFRNLKKNK